MTPAATAALILAAGAGSRLGGPKALVTLGDSLLVERALATALEAGCDPVVVVLGASADEVLARASLSGAATVVNPDWPEGLGSSLRCGLAALGPSGCSAAVVLLVDQPSVTADLVRRLSSYPRGEAAAVVASYGGQPRTPVLLHRSVWPEVGALARGDVGARAWLQAYPDRVVAVECGDLGDAADIDTPADLARTDNHPAAAKRNRQVQ